MRLRACHSLALAVLLVQAVCGSLGPAGAVICISHSTHIDHQHQQEVAVSCGPHSCCTGPPLRPSARPERESPAPSIAFAPPCEDECPSCVDIDLIAPEMLIGHRVELPLDALLADVLPSVQFADSAATQFILHVVQQATGPPPPLLIAGPNAAVIRSTRLII